MSRGIRKDDVIVFVVAVIIMLVFLFRINVMKTPYYSDEFGYWAAGAWMNKIDWSPIFSRSGYYGWGYGIVLAPLFFVKNSALRFQMALALNAVMMTGAYALLVSINRKIFPDIKKHIISIISATAIFYSYNIVYSHLTMCECALTFLFLLSIKGIISVYEKRNIKSILFFSLTLGMQTATHLRTIIFIAAGGVAICCLAYNQKISKRKLMLFGIFILVIMAIVMFVKGRLVLSQYTSTDGNITITHPEGNDSFLGMLSSLKKIISPATWKWLFFSCVGKWFYLGCASFFTAWIGMRYIIQYSILALKHKKFDEKNVIMVYIVVSFMGAFLLNAWTMAFATRFDQIFYGRYVENVVLIIIAIGLLALINKGTKIKEMSIYVFIALIMSIVLKWFIRTNEFIGALPLENSGFAGIMIRENQDYEFQFTIYAALVMILCATVWYLVFRNNKIVGCVVLSIAWIIIAYRGLEICAYGELPRQEIMIEVAKEVMESDQKVYMLLPDNDIAGFVDMLYLQYHMGSKTMSIIEPDDLEKIETGDWLIISRRRPDCDVIAGKYCNIWKKNYVYIAQCN